MTPARARRLRSALGAVALVLVCIGFFVHGLHDWVRVLMFVAIVGVAAWGNGAQTQLKTREPAPVPPRDAIASIDAALPVEQKLAD